MIWALAYLVAIPLFILYIVVLTIAIIGVFQLLYNFHPKRRQHLDQRIKSVSSLEPVTILRPLKGIDSDMETTLKSSFEQIYDSSKLELIFCVQDPQDPCIPLVKKLISQYPNIDAKLLIDTIDTPTREVYGPNPKINNLAKGYLKAKYDIIWIMDSNVWSRNDTLKRSIFSLMNNISNDSTWVSPLNKKVKLITHIPLAWTKTGYNLKNWGAYLDEMFMSSSHAKFYTGINRVQLSPCINGKSNIFRRSDLDLAVSKYGVECNFGEGIRYFAKYIGEDNMMGIALWENINGCAALSMDMVLQPLNGQNSILDYIDRRVRWLRVRKYMVLAATMVEPFTESLLSGLVGAFSLNVLFRETIGVWWGWFAFHMICWFISDYNQYFSIYEYLNYDSNIQVDVSRRSTQHFIMFWVLRELLAFPIWVTAVTGSKITWRGQPFRILKDLSTEML